MDLKTFVADTLTQIVEGVAEAKGRFAAGNTGAKINPNVGDHGRASPVEFDLALTVTTDNSVTGSVKGEARGGVISIFQAKVNAEAGASNGTQNQEVSRVRFSVMLAQPADLKPTPRIPQTTVHSF